MTISKTMQDAFNAQITAELWSSNLYLEMAFWFRREGWNGFARWMFKQAAEEREHALGMADYVLRRGGEAKISAIDAVPTDWADVRAVFEDTLKHERHVTDLINALAGVAESEKDRASENFIAKYIDEQVEEEETVSEILGKLNRKEGCPVDHLDADLGRRE